MSTLENSRISSLNLKMSEKVSAFFAVATVGALYMGSRALRNPTAKQTFKQGVKMSGNTPKTSIWGDWGKKFYEGGFEKEMTRQEAAKILGLRASSSKDRIMGRYRTLMKTNHPDLGGSLYISTKVNEAKEILVKTAREDEKKRR